ncbi:GTP pyrophosphokinase [Paenibacillus sp. SYP-B3998]|uniref:GTP pyrophosphokinase n=1 Tax=Paenibacillus sp. SYP-B3998 TaxID=2678564 RepID=UPI0019685347|nr:GTP pyrophosphokinase [Paenibacillus sp. SYP-B3998]
MSTLSRAIIIATQAHEGQIDKGGKPYILHPLRLMLKAPDNDSKVVSVLHDVIEDTDVTMEQLKEEGFSEVIIEAANIGIPSLNNYSCSTDTSFISSSKSSNIL